MGHRCKVCLVKGCFKSTWIVYEKRNFTRESNEKRHLTMCFVDKIRHYGHAKDEVAFGWSSPFDGAVSGSFPLFHLLESAKQNIINRLEHLDESRGAQHSTTFTDNSSRKRRKQVSLKFSRYNLLNWGIPLLLAAPAPTARTLVGSKSSSVCVCVGYVIYFTMVWKIALTTPFDTSTTSTQAVSVTGSTH